MQQEVISIKQETSEFMISEAPFYAEQTSEVALFELAYKNRLPVMLKGPTGSGKTRLVEHMAHKLGRPLYTVACHEDLTAGDLVGRYIIKGSEVVWLDGPVLMAVKTGGIVYLDEIVEARKDVSVIIHPLTDYRRCLPVDKLGKQFKAPDEFMLVISYNPNYQSVIKELKPSTRQRFVSIELGWPEQKIETQVVWRESGICIETAELLVRAAHKIRGLVTQGLEEGVSTRELIHAARLIDSGANAREALVATCVEPLTSEEDMKLAIVEIIKNFLKI